MQNEGMEQTQVAKCLHTDFYKNASIFPHREALIWEEAGCRRCLTYGELCKEALLLAGMLVEQGVMQGDYVAVLLPKGAEQVIAVLGVLAAGGAYVPVNVNHPLSRKTDILAIGGIQHVISDSTYGKELLRNTDLQVCNTKDRNRYAPLKDIVGIENKTPSYVIFTSGSTGEPKGVVICHEAVLNTIEDVNERFSVTAEDRVAAVSELDFDLSVYDIFGLLSVGGSIVVFDETTKKEAVVWNEIIRKYEVTIWNSVPAIYEMLLAAAHHDEAVLPLKKVFLSGDWIALELFEKNRQRTNACRFISMGGATEASIWSNYYEVDELDLSWNSIPYGRALRNQILKAVDENDLECPPDLPGELWIGGAGVARGYLNRPNLTKKHFVQMEGISWYKTGDLVRRDREGVFEFLGRIDNQVKIRGYRIELGEIENLLKKYDGIEDAVVEVVQLGAGKSLQAAVKFDSGNQLETVVLHKKEQGSLNEDKEREATATLVENFLRKLTSETTSTDVLAMQNTYQLWISWLKKRQKTKQEGSIDEVQAEQAGDAVMVHALENTLFSKIEPYRQILKGEEPPESILKEQELTPEYLSMQSAGVQRWVNLISDCVNEKIKAQKQVRVAILHARTGLLAQALLEKASCAEYTLFDVSHGMLHEAMDRLAKIPGDVNYVQFIDGLVERQYIAQYDYVVAANCLHTESNPVAGLDRAALMLKKNGVLMAVEYTELEPMALITSALLEDGFTESNGNPFYSITQWKKAFCTSLFENVEMTSRSKERVILFEAKCKDYPAVTLGSLNEYAAGHLPVYMQPAEYHILLQKLLTANGKIDRKKIKNLMERKIKKKSSRENYTETEGIIAGFWVGLLDARQPLKEESFFEAGGDSLLAIRLLLQVGKTFDVEVSLKELFENPQLQQLALLVEAKTIQNGEIVEGEI